MLSHQLQLFLKVVESGSFSRVARTVFVTPSAVMKQINALEERLGVPLLERGSQGVQPTTAGKRLYEEGKILERSAKEALKRVLGTETAHLVRIGSSLLNPGHLLTDVCAAHAQAFADYTIRIVPYDDDRERILSLIASLGERIDLLPGIFNSRAMQACARYLPLGTLQLCVCLPAGHRLAQREMLQLEDLHNETLMMIRRGDTPLLDAFAARLALEHPQIHIEETDYFYDIETFNACARTGSLLLSLEAWKGVHPGLVTRPLDVEVRIPYGVLAPRKPSPTVEGFLRLIARVQKGEGQKQEPGLSPGQEQRQKETGTGRPPGTTGRN